MMADTAAREAILWREILAGNTRSFEKWTLEQNLRRYVSALREFSQSGPKEVARINQQICDTK